MKNIMRRKRKERERDKLISSSIIRSLISTIRQEIKKWEKNLKENE